MRSSLPHGRSTFGTTLALALTLSMAALAGCHHEPPTWDPAPGPVAAQAASANASASAPGSGSNDGTASVAFPTYGDTLPRHAESDASTVPGSEAAPAASALAMPDTGALPQTHDKPTTTTPIFDARAKALFDAIVDDAPERAMPFFFPVEAYEQVKAITNPQRDWRIRLAAAYMRDIHDLHLRLGHNGSKAKLVRLDVPDARATWVEPGEEYNKIGYYRVFGSKLRYEVDGHPHDIEVRSLISWRGEWFVVHFNGMK